MQWSRLVRNWVSAHVVVSALIGLAATAAIAAVIVVPQLSSAVEPTAQVSRTPTPSPTATASSTPTATPTAAAEAPAEPEAPEAAAPSAPSAPAAPKPAQPQLLDPGIIAMNPGASTGCGEYPSGQATYLTFSWSARDGNSVDVYYALTDSSAQATGGFTLLGSGLATSGSVQVPRTCPVGEGVLPYATVKLVASNALGSATAYYWGLGG